MPGESIPLQGWRVAGAPLWWARGLTSATALAEGYAIGCVNGASVLLRSELGLSNREIGWFVGVGYFCMALGAPLGGALGDRLGRKPALAGSFLALILGALAMASAPGFGLLFAGRALNTTGVGAGQSIVATYMAEVAPTAWRGRLGGLEQPLTVTGFVLAFWVSWLLLDAAHGWRWMLGLGVLFPLLVLPALQLDRLPESPRFLAACGRRQEAALVLRSLVGEPEAAATLRVWALEEAAGPASWRDVLRPAGRAERRALSAAMGVMLLQQANGYPVVTSYSNHILHRELTASVAFFASLLIGAVRLVFSLAALLLVDVVGRRTLLLGSAAGVAASTGAVALAYFRGVAALPGKLTLLLLLSAAYELGLAPVPWLYVGEVLATRVRGKGVAAAFALSRSYCGIMLIGFPVAVNAFGHGLCFLFFAAVTVAGFSFLYACAPETMGVSLEDMHKVFRDAGHGHEEAGEGDA